MAFRPLNTSTTGRLQSLELVALPLALTDRSWRLLYYNTAFRALVARRETVFPAGEIGDIFPAFPMLLQTVGLQAKYAQVEEPAGNKVWDLYVQEADRDILHIDGYVFTLADRTDEHNLWQNEIEYSTHHRQFLALTNNAVIIHRMGVILYANEQADRMIGMQNEETLVGQSVWQFVGEEFKQIVAERIRNISNSSAPSPPIEEKFIRKDGSIIDVEVFAFPVMYEGAPAIKTFISDISLRKQAEKELVESRQQYHSLVENITDIIFQTDVDGNFTFLNGVWEKLSGYSVRETLGTSCFDYLRHPVHQDHFVQKIKKLITYGSQEYQYDLLMNIRNEAPRYMEASIKPIRSENGHIVGVNGVLRDVHTRKTAELEVRRIQKTLKHHQQVLNSITHEDWLVTGDFAQAVQHIARLTSETLGISRVTIWRFSPDYSALMGLVNYNRLENAFQEILTFNVHEFPQYFNHLLHTRIIISDNAQDDEQFIEFRENYILPNQIISMMDIAINNGDDLWGVICMESQNSYHKWTVEDQSFARSVSDFITLAHKSSELKSAQLALINKERQYSELFEQARDAIVTFDRSLNLIAVNAAACQLSGYSREELLSLRGMDLVPKRYHHHYQDPNLLIPKFNYYFGEKIFVRKDGMERTAEISVRMLDNGQILTIARDVTERKLQELALRESETRLDLALKGADLGTWDFYIQDDRMVHNKRWAEMLGYYFENTVVTEQYWEQFIHPDDKTAAYTAFREHIEGKRPTYEAEIRMLSSNGQWKWILDKGKVVEWDRSGKPVRASGIHQDITQIKQVQQKLLRQQAFLQELIDAIPNLVCVINRSGEHVIVNKAFTDFTGISLKPGHKRINRSIFGQDALKEFSKTEKEVFIEGRAHITEAWNFVHSQTGDSIWLQTITVPLVDESGNFNEVLSVSVDITELKLKEAEISALNDQLEQKVVTRTNALEQANKELETFNYSVSHDLRTPLRSIDIFAYLLEKHYSAILGADGKEHIDQIRKSVVKMSKLIDNLLIFSKMGRSDRHEEPVDLEELIADIVEDFSSQIDLSAYTLHIRKLPVVTADKDMLRQAIANLMSNAFKYSSTRTQPMVEIFSNSDNRWHTIGFRDNGVGFSNELTDKLFKVFKRLHSEEEFEGSGVGLAIVDRIIKRHGGRVWAESREGTGSTFYISLPV